jgi:hypothetical protein
VQTGLQEQPISNSCIWQSAELNALLRHGAILRNNETPTSIFFSISVQTVYLLPLVSSNLKVVEMEAINIDSSFIFQLILILIGAEIILNIDFNNIRKENHNKLTMHGDFNQ